MSSEHQKNLRVLILEDNEDDFEMVLRQLKRGGYQVDAIRVDRESDFREALEKQKVDLILCDYLLPAFNAESALQVFTQSHIDVPFIVLSGIIGEETAVKMIKAGAHDYLLKDRLTRLNSAVERELRAAEARRELHKLRSRAQGG
jgi:DNA-binding NtrC family response regulator